MRVRHVFIPKHFVYNSRTWRVRAPNIRDTIFVLAYPEIRASVSKQFWSQNDQLICKYCPALPEV